MLFVICYKNERTDNFFSCDLSDYIPGNNEALKQGHKVKMILIDALLFKGT